MPNWVYNRVKASNKVIRRLLNEKGQPTFENIVPQPPALLALINSELGHGDLLTIKALISYVFDKDSTPIEDLYMRQATYSGTLYDFIEDKVKEHPLPQLLLCKEMLEKYDTFYWYDWRCKYWGCKWDASAYFGTFDDSVDQIEFQTPWGAPEPIMSALVEEFPDEEIFWHCDEESCEFSVNFISRGDGTYYEEDTFPEWYTPYIYDEDDLSDAGIYDIASYKGLMEFLQENLGDAPYETTKESTSSGYCNVTLEVYNWEQLGGDHLYTVTYNNLEDDEHAN